MKFDADVAIVGYGPVGQALTIALAQRGHRVLVLERWASLYSLPRAVVYDHEVARILQSLGVADMLAPYISSSARYEWRNAKGDVLKAFDGLDQPAISGWPDKSGFSQPDLEAILDRRARSFADQVSIMQGWRVVSAVETECGVRVGAQQSDRSAQDCRSFDVKYLIGCDGAGSFVRQAMGSTYEDLGFSADWLVVDVRPNDPARWSDELIQLCDPVRPTTNISGGPGRRRLEFMLLPGETKDQMNNPDTAWALIEPHGWTRGNATLERHAVYTFRGCVASAWRNGRMILAGDAAHLTPPFAGQGLCAGLRDVAALYWRLDMVLRGLAHPQILNTYGTERAHHARRFINFAIELGKVICELDPTAAAGRDALLLGAAGRSEGRFPPSRLPASDCLHNDDSMAGELSLQARVSVEEKTGLFDDLIGGGFALISLDADPRGGLDDTQRAFMQRIGVKLVTIGADSSVVDVDGKYRQWFRSGNFGAVLVRPDFYVFGAGCAADLVESLRQAPFWSGAVAGRKKREGTTPDIREYFAARLEARISPTVLARRMAEDRGDILVIDVRNCHPELTSRIEGAIAVPADDTDAQQRLPAGRELILYSWDSACSLLPAVALRLIDKGHAVRELSGGYQAWQAGGYPTRDAVESLTGCGRRSGEPADSM